MARHTGKSVKGNVPPKDTDFEAAVQRDVAEWTGNIVRRVIDDIQPTVVAGIRARIAEIASRLAVPPTTESIAQGTESAWIGIDSLSRLRSHVGGRFQNLKERWLGAGFPLKEHRGDKLEPVTVEPVGWLELVSWLSRQGFEARTTESSKGFYFEIKKV